MLGRLRARARHDRVRFLRLAPALLVGLLRGKRFQEVVTVDAARTIYMPISPEQGELLYLVARSIQAQTIVEFGTSFGISTLYLAAAARDVVDSLIVKRHIKREEENGTLFAKKPSKPGGLGDRLAKMLEEQQQKYSETKKKNRKD